MSSNPISAQTPVDRPLKRRSPVLLIETSDCGYWDGGFGATGVLIRFEAVNGVEGAWVAFDSYGPLAGEGMALVWEPLTHLVYDPTEGEASYSTDGSPRA